MGTLECWTGCTSHLVDGKHHPHVPLPSLLSTCAQVSALHSTLCLRSMAYLQSLLWILAGDFVEAESFRRFMTTDRLREVMPVWVFFFF